MITAFSTSLMLAIAFFWPTSPLLADPGNSLTVSAAWARPTVPSQNVAAAYMRMQSKQGAKVIKIESDVSDVVEIHSMTMQNDIMRMRKIEVLELPAGRAVELTPGGIHLMLSGLKKPLNAGDVIVLSITVQNTDGTRATTKTSVAVGLNRPNAHSGH